MKNNLSLLFCCLAFALNGCQLIGRPAPTASKEALNNAVQADNSSKTNIPAAAPMPSALQQELTGGGLLAGVEQAPQEKRFNVSAHDVDAKVFFNSLVEDSPLSVAVHPSVSGTISLSLKGVTLPEVLKVVQDIYGYEISRSGKVLQIYPAGMRSETFSVNYLYMEREGLSLTSVSSGRITDSNNNSNGNNYNSSFQMSNNGDGLSGNRNQNSNSNTTNGTFISSKTKTDFWGKLQGTLESIIGASGGGRSVVVSPQAGLVTVRAFPDELRQIRQFLSQSEQHLQRQVVLEAKIVEVRLSDGYQQGIQWDNVLGTALANGNTSFNFSTSPGTIGNSISQTLGGVTSFSFNHNGADGNSDFGGLISLLKTQGDVDVLSSPRVTASNNQKAVIKVGTDEYYVTNVSTSTIASASTSTITPDVELTPFFSGIALDVTPQIDADGNVLLHVHPSVTEVSEQNKTISAGGAEPLELPLAQSEIRESDTVIRARSGDVVVIGGLMKSDSQNQESKVPLLGDIPLLGQLFTNKVTTVTKTELVILIKPTVVDANTWQQQLQQSQSLLDRWYPTSR
ncbi:pilus (MSHA type) biogenesis protein MshL [Shewanella sp. C32]|uniref:Pilus (MSHA type) biogenesis protein MshL n=1 Tax=Shewanella electrica TaxID=515560 RepID=A0ABT2FI77_9GAMM|nr:pilus (MSHA type) biogenesis protein MshL [Shewanella electrica]MCH1924124.1 pilus (MSHA type) biogenesis protein MshL [Shewanella electrica]MCS4556027.1 pilus (MSHA type) biogenesis protein MshL [Shewanella electrica]